MSMPLVYRNFQTPHSPHCFKERQATVTSCVHCTFLEMNLYKTLVATVARLGGGVCVSIQLSLTVSTVS
jgi:hypothetical protein